MHTLPRTAVAVVATAGLMFGAERGDSAIGAPVEANQDKVAACARHLGKEAMIATVPNDCSPFYSGDTSVLSSRQDFLAASRAEARDWQRKEELGIKILALPLFAASFALLGARRNGKQLTIEKPQLPSAKIFKFPARSTPEPGLEPNATEEAA